MKNYSLNIDSRIDSNHSITPFCSFPVINRSSPYTWRIFELEDFPLIQSWITCRQQMIFVCSDHGNKLTKKLVSTWMKNSEKAVIVSDSYDDRPVGFCTLSKNEIEDMPEEAIELCHLIVRPKCHYFKIGSFICSTGKELAKALGFKTVMGRSVPSNRFGKRLAIREKFIPVSRTMNWMHTGFLWYHYSISDNMKEL